MDSLKEILDALSEASKNKDAQKIQLLLMNFFASLPFIIKIGSLDSCNHIFTVLNQLSPVSERERITKSIQEHYTSQIYEDHQIEQDLCNEMSLASRPMKEKSTTLFPIESGESDTIQAFIESHLDKLVDIYFSFSPAIQKQTFQDFFKLLKSYPQKVPEIFPKIMEYQRENQISEENFIQISLLAVDANPKKVVSAIADSLLDFNSIASNADMRDKLANIQPLIRFLKETYKIYPEEYWDYIYVFIEILNPRFSSFSKDILEVLIYFATKGCGEILADLNLILDMLDIEGFDRESLVRLLRELNDFMKMPEFKIPDHERKQIKLNLYSRILFNFDNVSQICFDLLLNLVDSTENEEAELKQILDHLIEKKLLDPYLWIQYIDAYNNFRSRSDRDTSIPNINDYITQETLESHESLIERAIAFRAQWKNE